MTRSQIWKTIGLLLCLVTAASAGAVSFDPEMHHRIINTADAGGPYVSGDYLLLTYDAPQGTRMVSLAFEHEDYRSFHTYEKNRHGVFILTLPIPQGLEDLKYRLVVDGLWTVDPNAQSTRDTRGIRVSSVAIPKNDSIPKAGATRLMDGRIQFVYMAPAGGRVSVIGDFNRWDPYLTQMDESLSHPGVYSATIKVPSDAGFYRFVVNGRETVDPANPVNTRNGWGETASPLPR